MVAVRVTVGVAVAAIAVTATIVWLQGRSDYIAEPYAYARTADPRQIVLYVTVGLGDEVVGASIRETPATVTASLRVRQHYTDKPSLGVRIPHVVILGGPLDDRMVLDGKGRQLEERSLNIGRSSPEARRQEPPF